jgi:predicted nucleotide-binding protein
MTTIETSFSYDHLEYRLSERLRSALRYINSISKDEVLRCDNGCLAEIVREFAIAPPILRSDSNSIVADERVIELVDMLSDRKVGHTGRSFFIPIERSAEWLEGIDRQIVPSDESPVAFLGAEHSRLEIRLMLSLDDPQGELGRKLRYRIDLAEEYSRVVSRKIAEFNKVLAEKMGEDLNKRKTSIIKAESELDEIGCPRVHNPEHEKRTIQIERLLNYLRGYITVDKSLGQGVRTFIVHGHDHDVLYRLKDYIQNVLKLGEPTVLRDMPGLGKTLIEKFEQEAEAVEVVFVLLTPDDLAVSLREPEDQKRRARQNVILELGFFLGRLGRKSGRVLLLYKGSLEIPSDIDGVGYIDISNGIESAGEAIRRELSALGVLR